MSESVLAEIRVNVELKVLLIGNGGRALYMGAARIKP